MKVSIFGLGHVGAVSAGCLASLGHEIVGVDIDEAKVRAIGEGRSTVAEPGIDALLGEAMAGGRLRATLDADDAVQATELSLLCVGTPAGPGGDVDLRQVVAASRGIGAALRRKAGRHIVVVRSTVLPGTVRGTVALVIEAASGRRAGEGFGLAAVPEFLRRGSAVDDFFNPSQIVIGVDDDATASAIVPLFRALNGPLSVGTIEAAEMVKHVSNVWHGLKVAFANEVGALCQALAIDGGAVMDIFARDTKLNLSASYLRPGFAFGGPCLPKDIAALVHRAGVVAVDLPLTASILPANERRIAQAVDRVRASGRRRVSLVGLAFKADTGDLAGSPFLALAQRLIESGLDLRVFDPHVDFASRVGGAAGSCADGALLVSRVAVASLDQALAHGEAIVLGTRHRALAGLAGMLKPTQLLIDLG
jgi:GDP-mannose 6-dehydrogenase